MDGIVLRGLIIGRTGEQVSIVTDEGIALLAEVRAALTPGQLVAIRREGDRFFAFEPQPGPGEGPGIAWDAVAGAWRIVLGPLPAETVLNALGEEDFSLRFAAEWELYHRGKENVDLLRAGLDSPNWRIRAGCAALMDHLADGACRQLLLALLRDPHEKVRRAALHSVSCDACKDEPLCVDWVPEVAHLAETDRVVRVRRIATLMLGARREDPRAQETLLRLLRDRDAKVRTRARWALDGQRPSVPA